MVCGDRDHLCDLGARDHRDQAHRLELDMSSYCYSSSLGLHSQSVDGELSSLVQGVVPSSSASQPYPDGLGLPTPAVDATLKFQPPCLAIPSLR